MEEAPADPEQLHPMAWLCWVLSHASADTWHSGWQSKSPPWKAYANQKTKTTHLVIFFSQLSQIQTNTDITDVQRAQPKAAFTQE